MPTFNLREFVELVLAVQPDMSSKKISDFLQIKGHSVSWQVVAGIKGSLKK